MSDWMNSHLSILVLWTFIFATQLPCLAINTSSHDTLFAELSAKLSTDYKRCTGDTSAVKFDSLIRWKKINDARADDSSFKMIRRQYMESTGNVEGFCSCDVLAWNDARFKYQRSYEDSVKLLLAAKNDRDVDSILYKQDLAANPTSRFDFSGIPFGLSPMSFRIAFAEKVGQQLFEDGDSCRLEDIPIDGEHFAVTFFFNQQNRYYSYRITGYELTGKDYSTRISTQIHSLINWLSEKVGKPPKQEFFSIMELRQNELKVNASWNTDSLSAQAGIFCTGPKFLTELHVNRDILKPLPVPHNRHKTLGDQ